MKQIETGK